MSLPLRSQPFPLSVDADGVVRVGGTRVTLDTIVEAFEEGLSAEEIALEYPSVDLGDIYGAIGYYLRRKDEVEAYLRDRMHRADEVRRQNEALASPAGIRTRLLARRKG